MIETDFVGLLQSSTSDTIQNILGRSGKEAMVFLLGELDDLKDPAKLHSGLTKILGVHSTVLEKAIVKDLYRRLGLPYDPSKPFDFVVFVWSARSMAISSRSM